MQHSANNLDRYLKEMTMTEIIKMNFAMMDDMAIAFKDGSQVLENVLSEVNQIVSILEDGALLGEAGDQFASACRGPLASSVNRLKDKFEELQSDVIAAKEEMEAADREAGGLY